MTQNAKIQTVPKREIIHPDLRRLVKSMRMVLIRKYPDPEERQNVAAQIMQKVVAQTPDVVLKT